MRFVCLVSVLILAEEFCRFSFHFVFEVGLSPDLSGTINVGAFGSYQSFDSCLDLEISSFTHFDKHMEYGSLEF